MKKYIKQCFNNCYYSIIRNNEITAIKSNKADIPLHHIHPYIIDYFLHCRSHCVCHGTFS